ncbi:M20 family metallopeptidase [Paenibacillus nasutitermitis]|uniref:Metallohydrolase YodQ n=1 Tax=Paenibacillus nasutitermitis TaxID=1652958 RepID=A0A916Z8M1_9BACL|nr:M20/M25/M40 family metallo-hydrolase [Paenibacillus nasutitermitis]GGD80116.1 putative metallohydrolase YodQ [Paenibacillus nasutitermitis]
MNREQITIAIQQWVKTHRTEAIELARSLVQINSVNHPPTGNEAEYQRFFADWMVSEAAEVDIYELSEVPGLQEHPAYMASRQYDNRPNVVGRFFGANTGPSLLFSGHADTVYEGNEPWTYPPFSGQTADGKMYGRGAYDMKGGMAAALMAVKCLKNLSIPIAGNVYIESVVDEEHGGANGTLAGRLRGPNPDMAIIPEPSNMKLYPAHLGGGIWKATFIGKSGIGFAGEELISALEATVEFANLLKTYDRHRKEHLAVPAWWQDSRKAEVTLLTIFSGDVTRELQEKLPASGELNFWIEGYPGMTGEEIINDLWNFYDAQLSKYPHLQKCKPLIRPLIRYLSASEMKLDAKGTTFIRTVAESCEKVLDFSPASPVGSPFACDGFMFNLYSHTPALVLGPCGGNAHAADEFLDLNSYEQLIQWYAQIIVDWCGVLEVEGELL